jgi:hypothetical protein
MPVMTTFLYEITTIKKSAALTPAREAGWTESFLIDETDPTAPRLVTIADQIANKRIPLLANQARCIGYRFHSLTTNATRAYPFNFPLYGTAGDCDVPQAAILQRIWATNLINNRAYDMRGIPDDWIITGELNEAVFPYPAWRTFMNAICNFYGMMGTDLTSGRYKVKTISSSGLVQLDEEQTAIFPGDQVEFRRTKFDDTCCGSIGKFFVTAASTRTLQLDAWETGQTAHGGTVGPWSKPTFMDFYATNTSQGALGYGIKRVVMKKTGRPFDLYSGRRSKKCCVC